MVHVQDDGELETLKGLLSSMDPEDLPPEDSPSLFRWPENLRATVNFCETTSSATAGAPHTRRPGFLLTYSDGSTMLVSEREAHFILQAFILSPSATRSQAAASLSHISFLRPVLPVAPPVVHPAQAERPVWSVGATSGSRTAEALVLQAHAVVAAQLLAGDAVFRNLHESSQAQDNLRVQHVRLCLLPDGGAGEVAQSREDVRRLQTRLKQLLQHRGRGMHFEGSDLEDIVRDLEESVRAAAIGRA